VPGKGKTDTRPWTSEELAAIEQGAKAEGLSAEEALAQPGDEAVDVYEAVPAKAPGGPVYRNRP
jgi:hypothetical protein